MADLRNDEMADTTSDEHSPGSAFGITVLEQLLLAIIDGNPSNSSQTRHQRLNAAMKALVGQAASANPLPDDIDDKALIFMGSEHFSDKCKVTLHKLNNGKSGVENSPKVRSDLELAKLAASKFYDFADEQSRFSTTNRLREKFSGTYQRKQGKGSDVDYKRTYMYRAVEHDYIEETLEAQGLTQLCSELSAWGIKTKI